MTKHILLALSYSLLFLTTSAYAQFPETEKRIYILDVTASMEGGGSVKTDNIFGALKDSLVATISQIEDPYTEIAVIPFTDKIHKCIYGTLENKDSLIQELKKLRIQKGDTDIADAWQFGMGELDSTKANYIFLLTDGLHNCGPSTDTLYSRLRQWPSFSRHKYAYVFYVMLTDNAQDREIDAIADENENMWTIKSMNINAAFIRTSSDSKKNISENNQLKIHFSSSNSHFSVKDVGIRIEMQDTTYYSLGDLIPCDVDETDPMDSNKRVSRRESFILPIISKRPIMQMPIEYDTKFKISNSLGTESLYFTFMTPEVVSFKILNLGTREVYVEDSTSGEHLTGDINLGLLKVKGNSTSVFKNSFNIRFNEEALRCHSYINFKMLVDHHNGSDSLMCSSFGHRLVVAASGKSTITYLVNILPNITESSRLTGSFIAEIHDIDKINSEDVTTNVVNICRWHMDVEVEPDSSNSLMLLWCLLLALILFIMYLLMKAISKHTAANAVTPPPIQTSVLTNNNITTPKSSTQNTDTKSQKAEDESDDDDSDDKDKCPCNKKLWTFCRILKDSSSTLSERCGAFISLTDYLKTLSEKDGDKQRKKICPYIGILLDVFDDMDKPIPQSQNGHWTELEGNSKFIFNDIYSPDNSSKGWKVLVEDYKKDFNLDIDGSAQYINSRIDLRPYAVAKVEISYENDKIAKTKADDSLKAMVDLVKSRFEQVLQKVISEGGYADFNEYANGVHGRATVRNTPLTIHEDYDGKTFLLVPKYLHDSWPHYNGIAICNVIIGMKDYNKMSISQMTPLYNKVFDKLKNEVKQVIKGCFFDNLK